MKRKLVITFITLAFCLYGMIAVSGCKKENHVGVESVSFNVATATVNAGDTVNLAVTIRPSNAEYTDITVNSSNPSVAIVTNNDKAVQVIGIKAGAATIKVTVGSFSDTCRITVSGPEPQTYTVKLDKNGVLLGLGSTRVLSATVTPVEGSTVKWGSRNETVATVSYEGTKGKVTGKAEGVTMVFCMVNDNEDFKDSCLVVVVRPPIYPEARDSASMCINGIWWAPVNCGFDAENYKCGLLYQWGRGYGCGYKDMTSATAQYNDAGAIRQKSSVSNVPIAASSEAIDSFYIILQHGPDDWLSVRDDSRWNAGTDSEPVKADNDPCPEGWRVPTAAELNSLYGGANPPNPMVTRGGISGAYFNGTPNPGTDGVFLQAAGTREYFTGNGIHRGERGAYWSSAVTNAQGRALKFLAGSGHMFDYPRAEGFPVRCVHE